MVGRPAGRQMFYSLTRPELLDLLAATETLLAATGSAVALCPNFGTNSSSDSGTRSAGAADAQGVGVRGE